ncbi:MAG: rRNA maturation RNase YbeY [Candidatus Latescibacterota bacterium]
MVNINIFFGDEIDENLPVNNERLIKYARDILTEYGITAGEYNIIFIGDEYMAELNRLYKNREGTTDVLSFNLDNDQPEGVNGEVYISLDKARQQARELEVPFEEEVVRLITHGLLHIAGKVHDTEEKYKAMLEITEKLVKTFFNAGSRK